MPNSKQILRFVQSEVFTSWLLGVFAVCAFVVSIFGILAFSLIMNDCNCGKYGGRAVWDSDMAECRESPANKCCTPRKKSKNGDAICTREDLDRYMEMGGEQRGWRYFYVCTTFVVVAYIFSGCLLSFKKNLTSKDVIRSDIEDRWHMFVMIFVFVAIFLCFAIPLWLAGMDTNPVYVWFALYWPVFLAVVAIFAASVISTVYIRDHPVEQDKA